MRRIIEKIRTCITFHFTWHQLRHTFATELVRNNFDIYNISSILGHSDINTTKIYLSVDTDRLKKQLDEIPMFQRSLHQTQLKTMVMAKPRTMVMEQKKRKNSLIFIASFWFFYRIIGGSSGARTQDLLLKRTVST